jgi:hypothetical protein
MSSRYNALATFFRAPGNVYQVFTLVDCVAAGNNWLWDKAIEHGAHTVTVQVDENAGRIPMHAPHTNERPLTNVLLRLGNRGEVSEFYRALAARQRACIPLFASRLWAAVNLSWTVCRGRSASCH